VRTSRAGGKAFFRTLTTARPGCQACPQSRDRAYVTSQEEPSPRLGPGAQGQRGGDLASPLRGSGLESRRLGADSVGLAERYRFAAAGAAVVRRRADRRSRFQSGTPGVRTCEWACETPSPCSAMGARRRPTGSASAQYMPAFPRDVETHTNRVSGTCRHLSVALSHQPPRVRSSLRATTSHTRARPRPPDDRFLRPALLSTSCRLDFLPYPWLTASGEKSVFLPRRLPEGREYTAGADMR